MTTLLPSYRGRLTEGITYDPRNNLLLWVDIIAAQVHRVGLDQNGSPLAGSHQQVHIEKSGESVGAIALTAEIDKVLVCAKYGVSAVKFDGALTKVEALKYIVKYPESLHGEDMRSNDGIVDPWGNLWVGTMLDFSVGHIDPKGVLYRINCSDWSIKPMLKNTHIANGLAFVADGKQLLWTDSLTFTIWRFDYDHEKVELFNKRPFVDTRTVETLQGLNSPEPDGLTVAENGDVFTAVFSSSRVLRFNEGGEFLEEFRFQAERITCCIFGGPNRDILYVTSGQTHLDDPSKCDGPEKSLGDRGGFLFHVPVGVVGRLKNVWKGEV